MVIQGAQKKDLKRHLKPWEIGYKKLLEYEFMKFAPFLPLFDSLAETDRKKYKIKSGLNP